IADEHKPSPGQRSCEAGRLGYYVSKAPSKLLQVPGRFPFRSVSYRLHWRSRDEFWTRWFRMTPDFAEIEPAERVVARFICGYHKIWQAYFPGLNKRAHWHVLFSARSSPDEGVSCRSVHRTLYGLYGTDIRTCIERIKDCETDGFVRVVD